MSNIPDANAQEAAATASAKGMVDLPEDDVLSLYSGQPPAPSGSPEPEPDIVPEPRKSKPAAAPVSTEPPPAVEPEPVDEGEPDELLFLSLDDPKPASKAKGQAPTPDESTMSPEDRRRLWQSKYDQEREMRIRSEARLAALEERLNQSPVQPTTPVGTPIVSPAKGTASFSKSPADFMPAGLEYVPFDAADPTSPSGRAFTQFQDAQRQYDREAIKAELMNDIKSERAQERQAEFLTRQVDILRQKTKLSDDEIREFIGEVAQPRDDQLYLMYLAHQFSKGRVPIRRADIPKLMEAYKPNGNGRGSAAQTAPSGTPPKQVQVPTGIAMFADFANATL